MQIVSISALSAFVIATAGTVNASPAAHDVNIVQRATSHHRALVRDVHAAAPLKPRAVSPVAAVPPTLKKRSSSSKQKRCRLRPTSTVIATATETSSAIPDITATIDGAGGNQDNHHHGSSTSSSPAPSSTDSGNYSSQWQLSLSHAGDSFFDGWAFWDQADPTHGSVTFVNEGDARNEGLAYVANGQAFMKANTDDNVGYRKSIRITDNHAFNVNTLLLMDAAHMPTGCSTWPAFWSNGANWPAGGEIDIVEGVNGQQQNQGTLHTNPGCSASSDDTHPSSGQLLNGNCGVSNGDNTGCGFLDTNSDNSFGSGFNSNGGGVFAMQWVDTGISMWFFPRSAIPGDITAEHPEPWTWPSPFGHWAASTCPTNEFFTDNNAIFDLTFCGDWAGATWSGSGCADSTGFQSCQDYVSAMGSGFTEAFWAINYVKYFNQ